VAEELYFQGSFRILPCSPIFSTNSLPVSFFSSPAFLRRLSCVLSLLCPVLPAQQARAQAPHVVNQAPVEFTGAVFSTSGQPLAGATVAVEGKALQTAIANAEGFFLLRLPAGQPARLVVAFPSHETQVITLNAPEKEKNLVVTLPQLSKYSADAKALRARQKKYRRMQQ
jgi:CarboxypepD_reg-like domain